jgi:putative hydrolase of the HAD superfamily
MPIRAVLFDLGDTLWHFPSFPSDATVTSALAERVERQLKVWSLCDGVDCTALALAVRQGMWDVTQEAELGHGRNPDFPELVRSRAAEHGVHISIEQATALWDAWHLGGAYLGREIFPDALPTLVELHRRGFRLGAVTNRSHGGNRFLDELRETGFLEFFETLAISCDDGWLKPHRALFLRALDDLRIGPVEAVMVGDQLRADVMGAKALGMTAVWKRARGWERQQPATLSDGTPALPDYTIDRIDELLGLPILAGVHVEPRRSSGTEADRPALREHARDDDS